MKRVLVTGAAGFIGSWVTDALLARGDRVVALDNFNDYYDPRLKRANLAGAIEQDAFTLCEGDIRDEARGFAMAAAKVAKERHCSDIVILDLRGISPATNYFVIATGTSARQMRTVADEISDEARKMNIQRFGRAGYEQARWILLDYVDVVIHLFDEQYRDYFDLELLWGDAKRLTIDD